MFAKLFASSLLIAVLGCLMLGCSDDTRRVTSPGTVLQSDPLSTAIDGTNGQTDVASDTGYVYYPYDTAAANGDNWSALDDPRDRFNNDHDLSHKPQDHGIGRE